MTEKRPHADLASKYYSDSKMYCWVWKEAEQGWRMVVSPCWYEYEIYEVSEHRPEHKLKRQVTMVGITFNAPESVKPKRNTVYWVPNITSASIRSSPKQWRDNELDRKFLENGFVQLNKEDAELHAKALIELSRGLK